MLKLITDCRAPECVMRVEHSASQLQARLEGAKPSGADCRNMATTRWRRDRVLRRWSLAAAMCIALLAALGLGTAAFAERPLRASGGSNLLTYDPGPCLGVWCRKPLGSLGTPPLQPGTIPDGWDNVNIKTYLATYHTDNVRDVTKQRLKDLLNNGQRKLALVVLTYRFSEANLKDYPSGRGLFIPSNSGALPRQVKTNLQRFLQDVIDARGDVPPYVGNSFNELTARAFPFDSNASGCFNDTNFDSLAGENWRFLVDFMSAVKATMDSADAIDVWFDLAGEASGLSEDNVPAQSLETLGTSVCAADSPAHQRRRYMKYIWQRYVPMFGTGDTIGGSIIASIDNANGNARQGIAIDEYREAMTEASPALTLPTERLPIRLGLDVYWSLNPGSSLQSAYEGILSATKSSLDAREVGEIQLVLQETHYNSVSLHAALQTASAGLNIQSVYQWPTDEGGFPGGYPPSGGKILDYVVANPFVFRYLGPPQGRGADQLGNGDFESGTSGWTGVTLAAGGYPTKTSSRYAVVGSGRTMSKSMNGLPAGSYTLRGRYKIAGANPTVKVGGQDCNGTTGYGANQKIFLPTMAVGSWTKLMVPITVSDAGNCTIYVSNDGPNAVSVDNLTFTKDVEGYTEGDYTGTLETATCTAITGYALDADVPNRSIAVDIYSDGAKVATVAANAYSASSGGNGLHGFSWTVPASLKDGYSHTIAVMAAGTSIHLIGSPTGITCRGTSGVNNVAAAMMGGSIGAGTSPAHHSGNYSAWNVIDGDRSGGDETGYYNDDTHQAFPDDVVIDFGGRKTITQVNVYSVQDNYQFPAIPTSSMTFTQYGLTDFTVFYKDANNAWRVLPNGAVSGNVMVRRPICFPAVSAAAIKVSVTGGLGGWTRIAEVEAFEGSTGDPCTIIGGASSGGGGNGGGGGGNGGGSTPTNVALPANGGQIDYSLTSPAHASGSYPAEAAINGDRTGAPASGNYYNDNTYGVFPDNLVINFSGSKDITEIDVFSVQDDYLHPVSPTETMTFSLYGLRSFTVYYKDSANAWQVVENGVVTGNNLVWKKLSFSSPIATTAIKVSVNGAADWTRIVEVEAWTGTGGGGRGGGKPR